MGDVFFALLHVVSLGVTQIEALPAALLVAKRPSHFLLTFVGWDEIPAWIGMAMLGFHPSLQKRMRRYESASGNASTHDIPRLRESTPNRPVHNSPHPLHKPPTMTKLS
jgi:hypothetical protein